jgi:hypothetical protein
MHDVNIIKKNVGVLAAFYSKSPTTPCSIFLGHFAVSTPAFFYNFADIFLISPTFDQSYFLLKRTVHTANYIVIRLSFRPKYNVYLITGVRNFINIY